MSIRLTKTSKYKAIRTECDGITFASKKEASRYAELKLLERAGEISGLVLQPKFDMVVSGVKVCRYIADFMFTDARTGKVIVEDVKSAFTKTIREYTIKKRLMLAVYGIEIHEV